MAQQKVIGYSYQYGTEAPKQPYHVPQPTKRPEFQPSKRPHKKPRPKADIIFGIQMSLCGLAVFGAALAFVHLTSQLSEKQNRLKAITAEIRETQSAINSTEAIIAGYLDLEDIQKRAEEELGMSEPLPHQVVYLELPQESYTVYD